ncbi:MAG: phosphoribosylformylglycinamidine cyclo-ligase [Candidatus Omnitrophica bacterium]|jgi:phosphoribosylformylglycinamidine cyclo-ligase|nr:phosphoribosylformylglycinamidine cyclo-ligase [Candidatus Omnitrophota bacterium]MDD5077708.1 phosphoribosylformylglycinamidine cyclo-ligase [Candidatus Omnitrophota bacterium]
MPGEGERVKKITYKKSGVDINSASIFKSKIKPLVRRSFRPEVLADIGGFGSFFRLDKNKYRDPVLVSSSDGVGTKLVIAGIAGKHDTVGIDAVAMNVNDILCTGAESLFFLDYIAFSKVKESVLVDVVKGINRGCRQAGCSLVGGETAQMPGMYRQGEYDIAGFCVGVVERDKIINGSKINPEDTIIGIASSGLHSNGYSLVRKVFKPLELKRMSAQLLEPTRIYVLPVLELLRRYGSAVHGIAHITGGAFYDKIGRILPAGIDAFIEKGSWKVPEIFKLIQSKGGIEDLEMYHTLNMGIGMVLVVKKESVPGIMKKLSEFKLESWVIGETRQGSGQVKIV